MKLPPTVEELAAQERADRGWRSRLRVRLRLPLSRPWIVAASAAAVVALGATAWAIARPDRSPNLPGSDVVQGLGP
uniref:hypothetical protein n=1 Tax=Allorhizocola rhizosphaerae TaxID=1872709 RepID=UPI001B8AB6C2